MQVWLKRESTGVIETVGHVKKTVTLGADDVGSRVCIRVTIRSQVKYFEKCNGPKRNSVVYDNQRLVQVTAIVTL